MVHNDSRLQPVRIDVPTPTDLAVEWGDGHTSRYDLEQLRRACSCAECTELRGQGQALWPRPGGPIGLEIHDAELIGAWGLSVRWNDGHETGVYTWESLRALCACRTCQNATSRS